MMWVMGDGLWVIGYGLWVFAHHLLPIAAQENNQSAVLHEQGHKSEDIGERIDHMMLKEGTLERGDSVVYPITFSEGPLEKDWLFLIGGRSFSDSGIDVELIYGNRLIQRWHWKAKEGPYWNTYLLPETGEYKIKVANRGSESSRYSVYYDVSCICSGKYLHLEKGVLLFHADLEAGNTAKVEFDLPVGSEFDISLFYRTGKDGVFPGDFMPLAFNYLPSDRTDIKVLEFTGKKGGRYFFFLKSKKGIGSVSRDITIEGKRVSRDKPVLFVTAAASIVIFLLLLYFIVIRQKVKIERLTD